ncbi:hypothetical protein LV89_02370 [Arcicella aurantiaca]|uniref:Uncharacterized protein n=1 Tax=Arcicella aurantiaca TaxID=591202 RepID=A0A316EAC7_9BACT|nr:hypothetical protein [Arcicella aurantiaca]PWK26522.1 hypothetical protein LV89_02370 [Arcicella aurantiaca]
MTLQETFNEASRLYNSTPLQGQEYIAMSAKIRVAIRDRNGFDKYILFYVDSCECVYSEIKHPSFSNGHLFFPAYTEKTFKIGSGFNIVQTIDPSMPSPPFDLENPILGADIPLITGKITTSTNPIAISGNLFQMIFNFPLMSDLNTHFNATGKENETVLFGARNDAFLFLKPISVFKGDNQVN